MPPPFWLILVTPAPPLPAVPHTPTRPVTAVPGLLPKPPAAAPLAVPITIDAPARKGFTMPAEKTDPPVPPAAPVPLLALPVPVQTAIWFQELPSGCRAKRVLRPNILGINRNRTGGKSSAGTAKEVAAPAVPPPPPPLAAPLAAQKPLPPLDPGPTRVAFSHCAPSGLYIGNHAPVPMKICLDRKSFGNGPGNDISSLPVLRSHPSRLQL